jgi:hypothetical protein
MEKLVVRRLAVSSSAWLDLFRGFESSLRMILKHSFGAAKQKRNDNNRQERASQRKRDQPCIKLKNDDKPDHRDNSHSAAAEDKKCKKARDSSDDDAEHYGDRGGKWSVLKILLRSEVVG